MLLQQKITAVITFDSSGHIYSVWTCF